MKKLIAFVLLTVVACPMAFADSGASKKGPDVILGNIESSAANFSAGPASAMELAHQEASKSNTPGGQILGVGVGGVKAVRKTLYHAGAGAIDLLTFWIPKKQPTARAEA